MTFKDYLVVMSIATIAAWIGWIVVIISIDPTRTSGSGFVFFYITFAMALLGTLAIVGAGARVWFQRDDLVSRHVIRSFRQAVLLTALIVGSLLLLSYGLFTWWTISLFILILAIIELVFMSSGHKKLHTD